MDFETVRCECGSVLFDGHFQGVVRVKCRGCKLRVWVGSDGDEVRVLMTDWPNRRILAADGSYPRSFTHPGADHAVLLAGVDRESA